MQYGRRSFGPQKPKSLVTRARYIAESILAHQAAGHTRTMEDYGITSAEMMKMIAQAIEQMTTKRAA